MSDSWSRAASSWATWPVLELRSVLERRLTDPACRLCDAVTACRPPRYDSISRLAAPAALMKRRVSPALGMVTDPGLNKFTIILQTVSLRHLAICSQLLRSSHEARIVGIQVLTVTHSGAFDKTLIRSRDRRGCMELSPHNSRDALCRS